MRSVFKVFLALLVCGISTNVIAAKPELQQSNLNGLGGAAYWKTCQKHNVSGDVPCIGASKGNCNPRILQNPKYSDEFGILMMVARATSVGGAQFCPTMIIGRNSNRGNAWTTYHSAGNGCVWLCKQGYTGSTCEQSASGTISTCNTSKLLQSNYDSVKAVSNDTTNIEDSIPNWGANLYRGCGLHKGQEHDLILAISNWLPSGRGAYARPYIIRAERDGWADMVSWIDVYPAATSGTGDMETRTTNTSSRLFCLDGFKPNAAGTDCEPINNDVCGIKNWCDGWNESRFKSDKHVEKMVGKCLQWRCKEAGQGVVSPGAENCEPCGDTAQDGINPNNGTCVHCPDGKIFSSTASGNCADTFYVDKNKLMYGVGSQSSAIADQCWTIPDLDKYKECVLENMQ